MQWWCPQGLIEDKSWAASSEDLGEMIKHAAPLAPLKSKLNPVVEKETDCRHPTSRLQRGGNQHIGWVSCMDCHARWRVPRKEVKKSEAKKMPAAPKAPTMSRGTSSQEPFNPMTFARQLEEKYAEMAMAHKEVVAQEMKMKENAETRRVHEELKLAQLQYNHLHREMKEAKMELHTQESAAEVKEPMMAEYGAMAMGSNYMEEQGLPRLRDVELCNAEEELVGGDGCYRESTEGDRELPRPGREGTFEGNCAYEKEISAEEVEVAVPIPISTEENWLRFRGDAAGQVKKIKDSGVFVIEAIYVEEGDAMMKIGEEELEDEDGVLGEDCTHPL